MRWVHRWRTKELERLRVGPGCCAAVDAHDALPDDIQAGCRRYGSSGLGGACCCACTCAGRAARLRDQRDSTTSARRSRGHQERVAAALAASTLLGWLRPRDRRPPAYPQSPSITVRARAGRSRPCSYTPRSKNDIEVKLESGICTICARHQVGDKDHAHPDSYSSAVPERAVATQEPSHHEPEMRAKLL